jgi:hypothetical protein
MYVVCILCGCMEVDCGVLFLVVVGGDCLDIRYRYRERQRERGRGGCFWRSGLIKVRSSRRETYVDSLKTWGQGTTGKKSLIGEGERYNKEFQDNPSVTATREANPYLVGMQSDNTCI